MKNLKSIFALCVMLIVISIVGCNKYSQDDPQLKAAKLPAVGGVGCKSYNISMTSSYDGHATTFVWTVVNPNPGNGSGTTVQDLSHIDFMADGCIEPGLSLSDLWSDVVEFSYNKNDGLGWVNLAIPVIEPDPSIRACTTTANVFKFDVGTKKSVPTNYKISIIGHWGESSNTAWFKSGVNTGCCSQVVQGIGCRILDDEFCSYSQGYYLASPHPWVASEVEVGGYVYTEAEARAIWLTSNAGGIEDSKKGFCQVIAIKLSGVQDPVALGYVAIIDGWLSSVGKLNPSYLPNQTASSILVYGNAKNAAGMIGNWIDDNHCN